MKTSIQPWLNVVNSSEAGTFYKKAFGATETYRMESPDGGLVLRLAVGEAEFWVSGQSISSGNDKPVTATLEFIKILLVVENPNELFDGAIQQGAKVVFPVGEEYGWRLGRLTDPFGFDWEIGKELQEEENKNL
ncbi:MAG: VOC family protein [Ginsengibacter sp.]